MKTEDTIARFKDLTVMVVGDIILDVYLDGNSTRLSPEAPVPVVDVSQERYFMGGAANVAVNVRALGARVLFCSVLGRDSAGRRVIRRLNALGIDTQAVVCDPGRTTIVKERVMSAGQLLARFDKGSEDPLDKAAEQSLAGMLRTAYERCDAILIADYNKGVLTPGIIHEIGRLHAAKPAFMAVDSRRLGQFRELHPSVVKPNYREAVSLLGLPEVTDRIPQLRKHAGKLCRATGASLSVVTLDADGAAILSSGKMLCHRYPPPVVRPQVVGAGDTFISAMTLALVSNAKSKEALKIALAAASISVSKEDTACCSELELRSFFAHERKFIPSLTVLAEVCELYRRQGRRIVFTNGCFDILHSGHVSYLKKASRLGDVMIVGVNTDDSIRRLKGEDRPINPMADRIEVLGSLEVVHHIVSFGEAGDDTPVELIKVVRPDVFVKGGDYAEKVLPEARFVEQFGGRVELVPFLADHSTTGVIRRIRRAAAQAALRSS